MVNKTNNDNNNELIGHNIKDPFSQGIDDEDVQSDADIKKPYNPSKIQVDSSVMTIFQVMRKVKRNEINLQPDFQRHFVWDNVRKSRLIESILIRIPLPAFYLDARNDNEWLIVDGLQRLGTLNEFMNNKNMRLYGLEFLSDQLNGATFDQLPRNFQRQIEDTNLYLYIIKPDTPPEVKFTIFYRINTGGLVLSAQEIRHCLFQGNSTKLLKKLAESDEFINATTGSINTKRMDDRECVLRYCAFHLTSYEQYVIPDLNLFLSKTMGTINGMTDENILELERSFIKAMKVSSAVFGRNAFRKMVERNGYRFPINKSLFEVWSVCLEKFNTERLISMRDKIVDGFISLITKDYDYLQSISQSTGNISRVKKRFEATEKVIREALQ